MWNGIYLILWSFTIALMVFWMNIQLLLCICAMVSFHHPCSPPFDIIYVSNSMQQSRSKKLVVAQLVKKFPTLCRTWRFITLLTKTQYWFLPRVKSVQSIVTVYFKTYFNIILLLTCSCHYWSLPFSFSDQNSVSIAFVSKRKVLLSWFPSFINVSVHVWYLIWGFCHNNCYLGV